MSLILQLKIATNGRNTIVGGNPFVHGPSHSVLMGNESSVALLTAGDVEERDVFY